jgi:hypothetical protein
MEQTPGALLESAVRGPSGDTITQGGNAMQIPILIEPVAGNGFRAQGVEQFGLNAEGATREEVLTKVKAQLAARLRSGAQMVPLEVAEPEAKNPWVEFAGMFENDPLFDDWQKAIEEYRREAEADPDYL